MKEGAANPSAARGGGRYSYTAEYGELQIPAKYAGARHNTNTTDRSCRNEWRETALRGPLCTKDSSHFITSSVLPKMTVKTYREYS